MRELKNLQQAGVIPGAVRTTQLTQGLRWPRFPKNGWYPAADGRFPVAWDGKSSHFRASHCGCDPGVCVRTPSDANSKPSFPVLLPGSPSIVSRQARSTSAAKALTSDWSATRDEKANDAVAPVREARRALRGGMDGGDANPMISSSSGFAIGTIAVANSTRRTSPGCDRSVMRRPALGSRRPHAPRES